MKSALILSCGGSPEPLIFCIKDLKPDFTYFLCSEGSVHIAEDIVKHCNVHEDQFNLKVVSNHESLEDCFAKSREIIQELQGEYDNVHVDFTGGTKPMVAGLVLAAIGEKCTYSYVGTENLKGRDKNGLGVVKDGFESIKGQRDPYDVFAVIEFNNGIEFFNKYQYEAAKLNFQEASEKLESDQLKELSQIYIELIEVYERWDKFNNVFGNNLKLNSRLKQILDIINNSNNLKTHFEENYPKFTLKMENNIKFLDLKLSRDGRIKPKNVEYYLPDLLNNAYRRIEEGKYDDAVARLYRSIELIAQMSLIKQNIINEKNLWDNAGFSINVVDVDSIQDIKVQETLETFSNYQKAKNNLKKTFTLASKNSYMLLKSLGSEFARDYLNDDEIRTNIDSRNSSILAHGLKPIDKKKANKIYSQVLTYAKRAFPEIVEYMDMADFPKFE